MSETPPFSTLNFIMISRKQSCIENLINSYEDGVLWDMLGIPQMLPKNWAILGDLVWRIILGDVPNRPN